MAKKLISAQDMVKKFHISYQTINRYTDLGLFNIVDRSNHSRMYDSTKTKKILAKISKLKNEGYPLGLICKKLNKK